MQSDDLQTQIVERFFQAVHQLISEKKIRGIQTFTNRYGINRRNFITVEREPLSGMFKTAWLTYLVTDFDISAEWLLTGQGEMRKRQNLANFLHPDILPIVSN